MKILAAGCLVFVMGCTTSPGPFWSNFMSSEDVEQTKGLVEALDQKFCVRATGSGSAYGVDGSIEVIRAEGTGVSMQDCFTYFNKSINPVILPSSRLRKEIPPPEE